MADLELMTIGRVSVDLFAEQLGKPIRDVTSFRKSVGGTATNVAIACARLGHSTALVTKVGDDQFGDYIRHALGQTFGVDTRFVGTDPELRTPLAFAELDPPDDPTIIFYRKPRAPDQNIDSVDVDFDLVREVPIFWVPASRFSDQRSAAAVKELLDVRNRRTHTVLDLDWRPMFWESAEQASAAIRPMLAKVTIAIGNRDECEIAVGTRDADVAADRMLEAGLEIAVVKLGSDGVMIATAAGERVSIPPYPIDVVCGLGAGDAFGGAFCHGLLSGWDPTKIVQWGNAAGAIVAGRLMCADDMPTAAEIESFLEGRASVARTAPGGTRKMGRNPGARGSSE